jgi:hypothetical protein
LFLAGSGVWDAHPVLAGGRDAGLLTRLLGSTGLRRGISVADLVARDDAVDLAVPLLGRTHVQRACPVLTIVGVGTVGVLQALTTFADLLVAELTKRGALHVGLALDVIDANRINTVLAICTISF